jgi:hypothetical protein
MNDIFVRYKTKILFERKSFLAKIIPSYDFSSRNIFKNHFHRFFDNRVGRLTQRILIVMQLMAIF